jgi:hypothetical protein
MIFRKFYLAIASVILFTVSVYAQTITGTVASKYPNAVFERADFKQPNYGFITNGSKFELLNTEVSTNPNYPSLNVILVKIISDKDGGKHVGRTGWLNVFDTDLNKHFNASARKIDLKYENTAAANNKAASNVDYSKLTAAPTGIFGAIDNDLGYDDEFFEKKDFSDIHGMIKNGASFEVMNTKVVTHPKYSTNQVMVKIKFDTEGKYTDMIGWIDILSTTLRKNFSQSTMTVSKEQVNDSYSGSTSNTTSYSSYSTTVESKTGITGAITETEIFDKKDFSSPDWGDLVPGTTFDLLNTKVIKHPKYGSLNMMLIKVTYDPNKLHDSKVGWVQVNKTSLINKFNTSTMTIGTTVVSNSSSSSGSYAEFANYKEFNTGITGAIAKESGSEVFDKKDFGSPTHGFVKNGATFELLNTTVVKHPIYSLDMILIKITYDPENKYTGKVGWVMANATSLNPRFNKSLMKIE